MIVNKDYIGVVKEVNGLLKIQEVPIPQDTILIDEFKAMRENPNKTIFDMQNHLDAHYSREQHDGKSLSYIYPYSYYDAYLGYACYPSFVEYDKYKKEMEEYKQQLQKMYLENEEDANYLKLLKQKSKQEYLKEYHKRLKIIDDKLLEKKQNYKSNFKPERYIYAHNYYSKVKKLGCNDATKMITTERIGWSDFPFQIDNDFSVFVKTNFGYGCASYFYCNVIYKGVSILPYTAVVNYCHVKWTDLIRYTRKYRPDRGNWMPALEFAVQTANLAKTNPAEFVQVWIVNELKDMMTGLRSIFTSKDANIKKYLNLKDEVGIGSYNLVRNFELRDKNEYNILPQEKIVAFKAEKITGCLLLLENLRKLTELTSYVNTCIDEIISMNNAIIPEILSHIDSVGADIERLENLLANVQKELEKIEATIEKFHKPHIEKIQKELNDEGKKYHQTYSYNDAERKYRQSNRAYDKLKKEYEEKAKRADELRSDIRLRQGFVDVLEKCMKRINKYMKAS